MESSTARVSQIDDDAIHFQQQFRTSRTFKVGIAVVGVAVVLIFSSLALSVYHLSLEIDSMRTKYEVAFDDLKGKLNQNKQQAAKQIELKAQTFSQMIDIKAASIQAQLNQPEINIKLTQLFNQNKENTRKIQQITKSMNDLEILTGVFEQKLKEDYHNKKMDSFHEYMKSPALQNQTVRNPLLLAQTNLDLQNTDVLVEKNMTATLKAEYNRLNQKYQIQSYKNEVPLCILIPTYNNINNWRYEYNLHSIITQNYTNYRILIIDDASTDQTNFMIRRYLKKHQIAQDKVKIIRNQVKKSALPNIYYAAHKFCKPEQKMMIIDGDDELIGKQIFKTLSSVYQAHQSVLVYSNHVTYLLYKKQIVIGYSDSYLPEHIEKNMYRDMDVLQRISQLRTFSVQHFRKIKDKDLKDANGNFFTITYDQSIFLPMAEMSCGRMTFIPEFFYIYNFGTGLNDYFINFQGQVKQAHHVRKNLPKYECRPQLGSVKNSTST